MGGRVRRTDVLLKCRYTANAGMTDGAICLAAPGVGRGRWITRAIVNSFFVSWAVQDVELAAMHFHRRHSLRASLRDERVAVHRGDARQGGGARPPVHDHQGLRLPEVRIAHQQRRRAISSARRSPFQYRHRQSGEILDGTRRLVFRLKDGLHHSHGQISRRPARRRVHAFDAASHDDRGRSWTRLRRQWRPAAIAAASDRSAVRGVRS